MLFLNGVASWIAPPLVWSARKVEDSIGVGKEERSSISVGCAFWSRCRILKLLIQYRACSEIGSQISADGGRG